MLFNIINLIKLHVVMKKKILIFKNINKNNLNIIKYFVKLNIIKFIFYKKNKLVLILKIYKNNKLLFNIKNLYKNSNYKNIKYKNIKKINNKKLILLISSNKGLLNNFEAYNKKTGGNVLMQIWN